MAERGLLVCTAFAALAFACGGTGGATQPSTTRYVVGASGNFRTIADALAAAPEGAAIRILAGTYRERVDITTNKIRLLAEGSLLDGEGDTSGASGIRIAADDVEVRGFVVQGFANGIGSGGARAVIASNEIRFCHSDYPAGWRGAGLGSSGAGAQVLDNVVHDNDGNGIVISGGETVVRGNRVYDNGAGADAMPASGHFGAGILAPVVEGRGFWTNPATIQVLDNEVLRNRWGIIFEGREALHGGISPGHGHLVRSNRVSGSRRAGIALFYTADSRIEGNDARGNGLQPMPPTFGFDLFDERPGQNAWVDNQGTRNW